MVLGRDQAELCHPGTRFCRPSEAAGCVDKPRLYDGPRPPLSPLPNSANIKTSLSAGPPRWKITSSQQRDRKNFIKLKNYSKEHFSLAEKKGRQGADLFPERRSTESLPCCAHTTDSGSAELSGCRERETRTLRPVWGKGSQTHRDNTSFPLCVQGWGQPKMSSGLRPLGDALPGWWRWCPSTLGHPG